MDFWADRLPPDPLFIHGVRVLFSVETNTITVLVVLRVRHRSEAYD